jgi:hypothetical protein
VFLRDVNTLDQKPSIIENLQDGAATALVLASSYDDIIAFSNLVHY